MARQLKNGLGVTYTRKIDASDPAAQQVPQPLGGTVPVIADAQNHEI
jgi:hypothetical protein